MDNQNTYIRSLIKERYDVLILVLMDNQNTVENGKLYYNEIES